MSDPIQQLVAMAPRPAVMTVTLTPEEGGSETNNNAIEVPTAPQQFPVLGAFSNAVDAELDGSAEAIFTITKAAYDTITGGVTADFSRVKVAGGDYTIDKVRKRFWFGVLNGYTFALRL